MLPQRTLVRLSCLSICCASVFCVSVLHSQELGTLDISVTDESNERVACRIHLQDPQGQAVKAPSLPFWRDHFVCTGNVNLQLAAGEYNYMIERGPEYQRVSGSVKVVAGQSAAVTRKLKRLNHLRQSGWYSSDLHIHRPIEQVELLMNAEDLDYGPVITWWNQYDLWQRKEIPTQTTRQFAGSRFLNVMAGEDEREGGALLFYGLKKPLGITKAEREYPSPMEFVQRARKINPAIWIDVEKPFWWDVPVWIASGQMNSIGIANNHMCHSSMYENEAWGRPRDSTRLPNPHGNGYWTQEIYYHILNTGIRIAPSAGSASGVLPNPVGYNRVYVHLDEPFSPDAWWKGLSNSNCFVTNGPLLLVTANHQLPGSVLKSKTIDLKIEVTSQDALAAIEIIKNGQIAKTITPTNAEKQTYEASLAIDGSCWFLVRAITDLEKTFRFASTAPFYVELAEQPIRISSSSCKFFADWVEERIARIEKNVRDPNKRKSVIAFQKNAHEYWVKRMQLSNAP